MLAFGKNANFSSAKASEGAGRRDYSQPGSGDKVARASEDESEDFVVTTFVFDLFRLNDE